MKIKIAIADSRLPAECERALMLRGYRVVSLPPSHRLPEPLSSHTDMLMCRIGGEYFTSADWCEVGAIAASEIYDITRARFHFTADIHGGKYPDDAIFNCLVMGKTVFARQKSFSPYVQREAVARGYKIVNVKQGYPACTVLKLNDGAAITADPGMADALESYGVRVYRISNGGIDLPPYEYGFIGGAGGVDGHTVYFIGDVTTHPDYSVISEAIECEGMRAVSLGRGRLIDLGGIIFAEGDIN